MSDGVIVAAIALLAGLIAVLRPIIALNINITKLTSAVTSLEELVKEKTDTLDKRITKHGEEIDDIKVKQAEHETRITHLERK